MGRGHVLVTDELVVCRGIRSSVPAVDSMVTTVGDFQTSNGHIVCTSKIKTITSGIPDTKSISNHW